MHVRQWHVKNILMFEEYHIQQNILGGKFSVHGEIFAVAACFKIIACGHLL